MHNDIDWVLERSRKKFVFKIITCYDTWQHTFQRKLDIGYFFGLDYESHEKWYVTLAIKSDYFWNSIAELRNTVRYDIYFLFRRTSTVNRSSVSMKDRKHGYSTTGGPTIVVILLRNIVYVSQLHVHENVQDREQNISHRINLLSRSTRDIRYKKG